MAIPHPRSDIASRRSIVVIIAMLAAVLAPATAGADTQTSTLTNLAHLDFLGETVTPPDQPGHTTYNLDTDPTVGAVWTYAEPNPDGSYRRIGGGTYDATTDMYGQGAFNADDMARAAVVYIRHWRQFGDDHSRRQAYQMLRGLTYLQTTTGDNAGNVVLWMQPDGTLNPSAEPVELPDPSDSDASYWLARTIWALGEGYRAFMNDDVDFAAFLAERLELAIDAVDRQVLAPRYGQFNTVDGLEWPAWLINDGADASSEAVYGLAAYVEAGGSPAAEQSLKQLADGIGIMQLGTTTEWPFGAIMPWAQSRSVWHAWGDQMAGALATAGLVTGTPEWIGAALTEVGSFTPHLLALGGPEHEWLPAPINRSQIAYNADATLHNIVNTAEATGSDGLHQLAGIAAAWFFGNNPAGEAMYDPATGRTFDGVSADGDINRNSGAESTIHGLLAMLVLDSDPDLAARSQIATRTDHVTWQFVEAESGTPFGTATIVTPESAWTGESLWSGDYVAADADGSLTIPVTLPTRDRYRVFAVTYRDEVPLGAATLNFNIAGRPAGSQAQGGAGSQGITAASGYLDIGTSGTNRSVPAGHAVLRVDVTGETTAKLDAVLLQPEIEWLILSDGTNAQGVLRSFSDRNRTQRIEVPDSAAEITAHAYTADGQLVAVATGRHGRIRAPIAAGGFTIVYAAETDLAGD